MRLLFLGTALVALAGCQSASDALWAKSRSAVDASCLESPECEFVNAPIKLGTTPVRLPQRRVDFFPVAEPLLFRNSDTHSWVAPVDTLTDGASIPGLFVPLIGNPTSPEFALASALHDAYCGIGNEDGPVFHGESWQDVHIMFYDALVAAGTDNTKAKIMFSAVWIGGPRWDEPLRDLSHLGDDRLLAILAGAITFIDDKDPDLETLVRYLEWHERRANEQARREARRDDRRRDNLDPGGN